MNDWMLDYQDRLLLILPEAGSDIQSSAFYKLSLKRYAHSVAGNCVGFRDSLTYLDFKRVISLCEREARRRGALLRVTDALREYIDGREMYLEARSRLGIELKNHEETLQERFCEYSEIVNGSMSRPLRDRQMWDSFFMCVMQKSGNFSVPGSGKTASVLGAYAYLKAKELVRRIVVICPKNAFGSWIDEFNICFDGKERLKCFNIQATAYTTAAAQKRGILYETGGCNLFLFNYESLPANREELKSLIDSQTLLVFDEVHKVKRIGGHYAERAVEIARDAFYVVAMTGTPIPNSYTDIYNFLHILFPDEYEEFFGFTPQFLREPNPGDRERINTHLQPFFCRTTKNQLGVPGANDDIIIPASANEDENRLMHILRMRYRHNLLVLPIRLLQLETNPQLLLHSLDLSDFRYLIDDTTETDEIDVADYSEEVREMISGMGETSKFAACTELVRRLVKEGKPVIVWCMFIDSIDRLAAALAADGIGVKRIYGEVPLEQRQQVLSEFKAGEFNVLLTNPHTLAESVSLHGICHDAVYFEYSYNLVHLLQSKDRIHRLGLPDGQYTQYYYLQQTYQTDIGDWSLGGAIYTRLMDKERIMLEAIDNQTLEALPTHKKDLEMIFAKLYFGE